MSKSRQDHIDFDRNYCTHYNSQLGKVGVTCSAGMDIKAIQNVPTENGFKWGPCIAGHTLEDPCSFCPKWERRSLEHAEKRADAIEEMFQRMTIIGPVITKWRKKPPFGKSETIECPVCKGRLHLSQSSYNGHVHGHCETKSCVSWME